MLGVHFGHTHELHKCTVSPAHSHDVKLKGARHLAQLPNCSAVSFSSFITANVYCNFCFCSHLLIHNKMVYNGAPLSIRTVNMREDQDMINRNKLRSIEPRITITFDL